MEARITKIHMTIHAWELKSVPRHQLRAHTAAWLKRVLYTVFPDAEVMVSFDEQLPLRDEQGNVHRAADLDLEAKGGSLEQREWLKEHMARNVINPLFRRVITSYRLADARHRAPMLVRPTADQRRQLRGDELLEVKPNWPWRKDGVAPRKLPID